MVVDVYLSDSTSTAPGDRILFCDSFEIFFSNQIFEKIGLKMMTPLVNNVLSKVFR